MNWLDKFIAELSPEWGYRRTQYRMAMQVSGAYEGARKNRRTEKWTVTPGSPNADLRWDLETLRLRSRDLVRNTPYAAKAVDVLSADIIGTGIPPRFQGDNAEQVKSAWDYFVEACDFEGHTDLYGLQALCARQQVENGASLILLRRPPARSNLKVPLQLQVLEPDYIDLNKNTDELPGGGCIVQGVEFDREGRRAAYWLFPKHPGEGKRSESKRVPADYVVHTFRKLRPGQVHGVPTFAPVMIKAKDLADYDDAELFSKRVQALFTVFIKTATPANSLNPTTKDSKGDRIEGLRPGGHYYLNPGEEVEFGNPSLSTGYGEYNWVQLHAFSAGVGIPYELVTGDLSRVNYSSIRAGLIPYRQHIDMLRWHTAIPGLCQPVFRAFQPVAEAMNLFSGPILKEWAPQRYESVDPIKDFTATLIAVRMGLKSLPAAISEQGEDFRSVLKEISEANKLLDELNLTLDSDPRKATRSGNIHIDVSQEAEDETED